MRVNIMRFEESARRRFLKSAGAGFAGGALIFPSGSFGQEIPTSAAKSAAEMGHPGEGAAGFFDVTAFGATGDGRTIDSVAINRAIEATAAAPTTAATLLWPAPAKPKAKPKAAGIATATATAPATRPALATAPTTATPKATAPAPMEPKANVRAAAPAMATKAITASTPAASSMPKAVAAYPQTIDFWPFFRKKLHIAKP